MLGLISIRNLEFFENYYLFWHQANIQKNHWISLKYLWYLLSAAVNKLNKVIGIIYKIKHKLTANVLLIIYHSLFSFHLSYITSVWGNACNIFINKLQIAQNKILRIIFNRPLRSHTADLYSINSNIIPVRAIYVIQTCFFIYLCLHQQTHSNTAFKLSNHQHFTRSHNLIQRPNISTLAGERCISFKGAQLYNYFWNKFGNCQSASIFKNKLLSFLNQPTVIERILKSLDFIVNEWNIFFYFPSSSLIFLFILFFESDTERIR